MRWVLYALITAAWLAAEFNLDSITDDGNIQAGWAVAFAAVYGFLIGRWWALAVPVVAAVGVVVYGLVKPACVDCSEEIPFLAGVFILALYVVLIDAGIVIGVAIRRRLRVPRSAERPQTAP